MPEIALPDGGTLHYRIDGGADAPVLMLSNSLASSLDMWDAQLDAFMGAGYRVLRYDSRGHGRSAVTAGPYTLEQLSSDALGLIDALAIERVSFLGCSMGGMVGQTLASRHGERLDALLLASTAAYMPTPEMWEQRIAAVRAGGMEAVVEATLERWFTPAGHASLPEVVRGVREMVLATPPDGFCACAAAIRDMDQRESIGAVRVPTLVLVGEHDPGTPVAAAEFIHQRIAGSRLVVLDEAAHFCQLEKAEAFNAACLDFLRAVS